MSYQPKRLNMRGFLAGHSISGEDISGTIFVLDRKSYTCPRYIRDDCGNWWTEDSNESDFERVVDKVVLKRLEALHIEDEQIKDERQQEVQRLAAGNDDLAFILQIHAEGHDGQMCPPSEFEGVQMYCVGRNASHEFYLGVKGGKRYYCSIGEGPYDEYDIPTCERHFEEITDWPSYLGHY